MLPSDGRKVLEKLINGEAVFKIVNEGIYRNTCSGKYRSPAYDVRIDRDR